MSDNMNDIIPDAEVHLSKEDKIKAIKRSVKKSANDWDGERSAMFSDKVHKVMDSRLPWDDEDIDVNQAYSQYDIIPLPSNGEDMGRAPPYA